MPFAVLQTERETEAEQKAKKRKVQRSIPRPKLTRKQLADRKRREKDPEGWLLYYGGKAMFPCPFSDGHKEIIHNTIDAAKTGTGSATAAPRGEGKTSVLRGVGVYLVAAKIVRFPVIVGWKHGDAKAALVSWLRMFTERETFACDYPHICAPFMHSVHATGLRNLTWKDTEKNTGAMVDKTEKIITLPDSLGAIACRSAQGDAKGLSVTLPDGTVLRPDFVLFDDAQDPKKAQSSEMVRKTIDVLENVFLGMAGPQKRLTAASAVTVEAEDDVSEHWLNRKGWKSIRISRIKTWPGGGDGGDWPDTNRPAYNLWEEWNITRIEHGEAAAIAFYKKNKAAMTKGMSVSWKHRYDKERGDPDAMYAAMWDRYNLGASVFSRAQQNMPIKQVITLYNLKPKAVLARVEKRDSVSVPDYAKTVLCATDINPSYALTTVVAAFGDDQRAAVVWYGTHPVVCDKRMTDSQVKASVHAALADHGRKIASLPCRPHQWTIDGGGSPQNTVIDFCANSQRICGMPAITSFGRAGTNYRPTGGKSRRVVIKEESHTVRERHDRQWIVWNAHYWMEQAQRGWLADFGAPGSCTLPEGHHQEFADQVCREVLVDKAELGGRVVWKWDHMPGPHDYADCMAMLYMLAASHANIGTGGYVSPVKPRKRYSQSDFSRG